MLGSVRDFPRRGLCNFLSRDLQGENTGLTAGPGMAALSHVLPRRMLCHVLPLDGAQHRSATPACKAAAVWANLLLLHSDWDLHLELQATVSTNSTSSTQHLPASPS